ncbi:MAG TPA: CheR family methyltransferase [Myxococcaceae bacterium]|nr:CheR family methyltransferase [Myxococcaceae bacterium]
MRDGPVEHLAELLGHRLAEDNRRLFEDGLQKTGLALGVSPDAAARRALAGDPVAYREVISAITVGETYFFRHPEHFQLARDHAARASNAGRPVRTAWSVGCATGEEAYSLALAISPHTPELRVFGTDISVEALEVARLGRYGSWSFRDGPPDRLGELRQVGGQWEVSARLKAMCTFHEANLAREPLHPPPGAPSHLDVIFCRNVLLYFLPDQAARLLAALSALLAEGGLLVLGALEAPAIPPVGLQAVPDSNGCALARPLFPRAPVERPPTPPRRYSTAERKALPGVDVLTMARRLADAGDLEGSLKMAESLPESIEALELASTVCFERGNLDRAKQHLAKLLQLRPDHVPAHLRLALVALRAHDLDLLEKSERELVRLVSGRRDDEEVSGDGMKVAYVRQVLADLRGLP